MKNSFHPARLVVLVLLASAFFFADTTLASAQYEPRYWAALAYSRSTWNLGYAYGKSSRNEAERIALDYCDANDAVILTSTTAAHLAFARGCNGSYGWATNDDRDEAESLAVSNCRRHCQHARLTRTICNGHAPSR
jgi:hypothetical protein